MGGGLHAAAGFVAEDEAGLVEGGGGIVDAAVGVVAVVGAACMDLDVLVAVLLLLLGEIDGGVHLGSQAVEEGALDAVAVEGIGAHGVHGLFVAAVGDLDPRACGGGVRHVEVADGVAGVVGAGADAAFAIVEIGKAVYAVVQVGGAELRAGAGGDGARPACQEEAAGVGDLQLVAARGAGVLEPVGAVGGVGLRDGVGLGGLARGERERAASGVEVLAGVGAEAHGAVAHGLGGVRALAGAGDDERVATAADAKRGGARREGRACRDRGKHRGENGAKLWHFHAGGPLGRQ